MTRPVTRLVRAVAVRLSCYRALLEARQSSANRLSRGGVRRLLVVCHGNIYRSAFVGAYFVRHPVPGIEFRTAGFHPVTGRPAPARHVELCRQVGVDLSGHRSAVVTAADIQWADLIVLMDRHNWLALLELGAVEERLVWLGALDGGPIELPDPYRLSDSDAAAIVRRLLACSIELAARLRA